MSYFPTSPTLHSLLCLSPYGARCFPLFITPHYSTPQRFPPILLRPPSLLLLSLNLCFSILVGHVPKPTALPASLISSISSEPLHISSTFLLTPRSHCSNLLFLQPFLFFFLYALLLFFLSFPFPSVLLFIDLLLSYCNHELQLLDH